MIVLGPWSSAFGFSADEKSAGEIIPVSRFSADGNSVHEKSVFGKWAYVKWAYEKYIAYLWAYEKLADVFQLIKLLSSSSPSSRGFYAWGKKKNCRVEMLPATLLPFCPFAVG
jgi:hypothetical protein